MKALCAAGIAAVLLPDAITIRVDGAQPSGCSSIPTLTLLAATQYSLLIRADSTVVAGPCAQAIVPYSVTMTLGPLAAGPSEARSTPRSRSPQPSRLVRCPRPARWNWG